MLSLIARIRCDAIRLPLLCVAFPLNLLHHVLTAAVPARWGGHPNKARLLQVDFYKLPVALFWAAWDGAFVP